MRTPARPTEPAGAPKKDAEVTLAIAKATRQQMILIAERETPDLGALYRLTEIALRRFLVGMVGDLALADDLLQETFLEACRAPGRIAAAEDPQAWLFGIARNRAISALRRRRRLAAATGRLAVRRRWEPNELPEAARSALDLVADLSPQDRALVLLRYVHGFDSSELASITGSSPAAIRKRLERSRARLAERLGKERD